MDRVIQSLMTSFAQKNELSSMPESSLFEAFSTYCIVSKVMDNDFNYNDIDDMQIGNGDDSGIDAIGILVNGEFVSNLQALEDILSEAKKNLDILMIMIQAKTSSKFAGSEMRVFGDGVSDLLRSEPRFRQNADLHEKWKMVNKLIEHASAIKSFRGRAYYVTTGVWNSDENLTGTIKLISEDVCTQNVFTDFDYKPVDSRMLRDYFTDSTTKISREIYFPKRVVMPEVTNIHEGWSGFLSGKEFLKLIVDDDGDLRRSLFYDNVRDFQGDAGANIGIRETLESSHPENMSILNNGVTIIADSARVARDNLILENYQIVNGCQTSYVMYNCRNNINETVFLPVKIIVTTNSEVSTKITISNNSQTAVKEEDLLALTEVQKELEAYFNSFEEKKRLFYERRSNQYNSRTDVEKVRIVPLSIALRSYSAMFLAIPHYASRYYGRLYKDYSQQVFDGKKSDIAFYTAAYTLYKYNFYIRNSAFDRKFAKFKYFVLLMVRLYLTGDATPEKSKKEIKKECEVINQVLWNEKKCKEVMTKMIAVIEKIAGDQITSNQLTSKKYFLDEVLKQVLPPRGTKK
ncbi:AIPR family protein [Sporolactobacillus sp. KGMB 08714]|uniref:AIPR family protein n=1 Tax=Sporolactobacillus sp. KGMB 08714 TaxID=3064704 RepID=UPI002FBDE3A4